MLTGRLVSPPRFVPLVRGFSVSCFIRSIRVIRGWAGLAVSALEPRQRNGFRPHLNRAYVHNRYTSQHRLRSGGRHLANYHDEARRRVSLSPPLKAPSAAVSP